MEFLAQYGMFILKSFTIVFAILFLTAGIFAISKKPKSKINISYLNKHYDDLKNSIEKVVFKKKSKKSKKSKTDDHTSYTYLIDFEGDIKASQVAALREEVSAILSVVTPKDEVIVKIESHGGTVNGYGLAASQLQRIRDKGIPLTVCIDKIAASGGYLMACVANKILAAPFAIIGSIGVVAQLPNFHRFLQKNNIDVELITAGEYKRTLTVFGKNTDKGRQKFQEDLDEIHQVFIDHILANRSQLNIEEVATGEHWLAKDAIGLNLIDKLQTSDEYIIEKISSSKAYKVSAETKQNMLNKLLNPAMKLIHPFA
ncbi:MAG: protease SohB [Legionellales bacterium RIFCSPHIGHO2_12_FULL_35_11]|nr:MAG: protease SohB [Legionellales bacterium RIFCSPHIGHO2_12_FULL_35_11]